MRILNLFENFKESVIGRALGTICSTTHKQILFFLLCLVPNVCSANSARAEFVVCDQYSNFLDGIENIENTNSCDVLTAFLIESRSKMNSKFISEYKNQFPKGTAFYSLSDALKSMSLGNSAGAYVFFDIAEPDVAIAFVKLEDEKRQRLYRFLIKSLKIEALEFEVKVNINVGADQATFSAALAFCSSIMA
jgi:hypothetical protein